MPTATKNLNRVTIRTITHASYAIDMPAESYPGFRRTFLLASDVHWDNAHCDQELFLKHLAQMKERDGYWMLNGDSL